MENNSYHDLIYRSQFLLGPHSINHLHRWQVHAISEELVLTAHPELTVTHCAVEGKSLTLIGHLLYPEQPDQDNQSILRWLLTTTSTAGDLIRSTYTLCGNWMLVYCNGDEQMVFHDCAGARSIYYTDRQKADQLWLASQPRLIAAIIGLEEDQRAIDFITAQRAKTDDYWWPGDTSPYAEIKALLPNHTLDLRQGKPSRFWPDRALSILPEEVAIEEVSKRLKGCMAAGSQRFDLALALSCGLDSRLMLAASKDIIDDVCVYNGKRPEMSKRHPDIDIPARLAKKLAKECILITQSNNVDAAFGEAYEINAPHPFRNILAGLQAELNYFHRKKVGATGNILETARFAYNIFDPDQSQLSGEYLAELTKMDGSSFAVEAFQDWIGSFKDLFNFNVFDLFFLEQRCGRWLSNNCLVIEMAWNDVFFPFNCRQLLIDLLSTPGSGRMPKDYLFYRKLIRCMWPELLSEPINPHKRERLAAKIRKAIKYFMHPTH